MANSGERRRHNREGVIAPISVRLDGSEDFVSGKLLNFSRDGMYIETDIPLAAGKLVSIRIDGEGGNAPDSLNPEFGGTVRWSRTLNNPFSARFGYGIILQD
jgi:hypothetical protein